MFVDRRVQQRRVPHPPAFIASEPVHFACQNKPWFLALVFARNIRLSFTLRSESSVPQWVIALNRTCGLEPKISEALA
jgi:hypothetical protein